MHNFYHIQVIDINKPDNAVNQVTTEADSRSSFHFLIALIDKLVPIHQFIQFCIVGGIGTLLNLLILFVSVEFFGIWYIYGAVLAFIGVITFNFLLNKIWTFKNREKRKKLVMGQYVKYIIIGSVGMGINIFALFILVEYFHIWYILAEIFAAIIAALWNFEGSRFIVFNEKKPKTDGTNPSK